MKVLIYKSDDGTKRDVPEFFRERLKMQEKMLEESEQKRKKQIRR